MRRVVLLLASSCLAAANAGCAVGVSGTVGMTLDTAGNVGLAAKVSGFSGLELTPHEAKQRHHAALSFPSAVDLFAGYDIGRRSGVFGADFALKGLYVADPRSLAVTAGGGVRIAGYVGADRSFAAVGPVAHLQVARVLRQETREGCQPGDAAQSWRLAGVSADAAWNMPGQGLPSFGTLFVGPTYGFAGTTALCFSERSTGRNSETGRVIEPPR